MATPPDQPGGGRPVVAIVTPWFPNPYEPITGIFVAKQAEALRKELEVPLIHVQLNCELLGWKLKDFILRRRRVADAVTGVLPAKVIYFPFRWITKLLGIKLTVRILSWRIRRALQRLRPRPAAALGWISWPTGCAVETAAHRAGMKAAVMECNGAFPDEAVRPKLRPHLLGLYGSRDTVQFTVSPLMSRLIRQALGCDFPSTEIGCVIDDSFFNLALERPPGGKLRGLCVGAVYEEKGQRFIVEAAALLKQAGREDFEIVCAGFGSGLEDFRRRAAAAGVDHLVKFPGVVTEEQKLHLYGSSHFFVMPTLQDTFGAVVAEAMAAGLPVVSTPNGAAEWIVDERSGILCPAGDATALAAALSRMLDQCAAFDRSAIRERVRALVGEQAYTSRVRTALGV